jgi:hypothetical protein
MVYRRMKRRVLGAIYLVVGIPVVLVSCWLWLMGRSFDLDIQPRTAYEYALAALLLLGILAAFATGPFIGEWLGIRFGLWTEKEARAGSEEERATLWTDSSLGNRRDHLPLALKLLFAACSIGLILYSLR